jgi:hypothetical protein
MTVGPNPRCSSPTGASTIARRMAGVGWVWVSLKRLIMAGADLTARHQFSQHHHPGVPGIFGCMTIFTSRVPGSIVCTFRWNDSADTCTATGGIVVQFETKPPVRSRRTALS